MNGISSNNLIGASSRARITGLSGFDTESMVKQLMQAERLPLTSLLQKRTIVQWRQDAYRDVTNTLRGFKSTYFDVLNKSSYILSKNSIKVMSAKSNNTSYLDVAASSETEAGSQTVKVVHVATADTAEAATKLSSDITGTVSNFNLSGTKIRVILDGTSRDVALENYTESDIASKLEASLNTAFGGTKFTVSYNAGKVSIGTTGGATNAMVRPPVNSASGLGGLGLTDGDSTRISLNRTLAELKDSFNIPMTFSGGKVNFTINGKLITADDDETLSKVFDRINNTADANVTIKYDELTDKVTITSKQLGVGDNLKLQDVSGNFLNAMGINLVNPVTSQGQDAEILINGDQQVVRSTNNFSVNGITYTLKSEHPAGSDGDTITIEQDADAAYNNVKSFLDKYNELIDKLNTKVSEKYDRDYPPLTDEQKAAMKDTDITTWETKAKTGLLQNDSILQKIVQDMRRALYERVDGTDLILKDIGITSNNYLDKGKLYIDEAKFKEALKNKPDEVAKLLNGEDPDNPTYSRTATSDQLKSRYNKSGLFQRLSDIVENNISTIRDKSSNKGILLEKAGIEGDMTFTDNMLDDELDDFDDRITAMQDRLDKTEERYYQQFTLMESYLQQMNAQSSWLAQQFSSGQ